MRKLVFCTLLLNCSISLKAQLPDASTVATKQDTLFVSSHKTSDEQHLNRGYSPTVKKRKKRRGRGIIRGFIIGFTSFLVGAVVVIGIIGSQINGFAA